jgi:hypothetical protein
MRTLARACLRLVTVAMPAFIAACYGVIAKYTTDGKVIDKDTHDPVSSIKVTCESATGADLGSAISANGDFFLAYDTPCEHLAATDLVTPARYQDSTTPFTTGHTVTVEMQKK